MPLGRELRATARRAKESHDHPPHYSGAQNASAPVTPTGRAAIVRSPDTVGIDTNRPGIVI